MYVCVDEYARIRISQHSNCKCSALIGQSPTRAMMDSMKAPTNTPFSQICCPGNFTAHKLTSRHKNSPLLLHNAVCATLQTFKVCIHTYHRNTCNCKYIFNTCVYTNIHIDMYIYCNHSSSIFHLSCCYGFFNQKIFAYALICYCFCCFAVYYTLNSVYLYI